LVYRILLKQNERDCCGCVHMIILTGKMKVKRIGMLVFNIIKFGENKVIWPVILAMTRYFTCIY
jgi:hypothetical protein